MARFRIDLGVFEMLALPICDIKLSKLQMLKLKRAFEDYLSSFNNERLLDIPENKIKVFMNMSHPLKTNGFNPETILHFIEFSKTYKIEK
jgi:3-methyladenine DNA glycosylase Tag